MCAYYRIYCRSSAASIILTFRSAALSGDGGTADAMRAPDDMQPRNRGIDFATINITSRITIALAPKLIVAVISSRVYMLLDFGAAACANCCYLQIFQALLRLLLVIVF